MDIQYIGHAGFIVRGGDFTIVMDPWLSDGGAYDASWF
tara:strand:+ start:446 stop:559 length:114 start_codon:yes stop_codon:yes gene_type:complete